jgi:type I restriction enzyme S subunit
VVDAPGPGQIFVIDTEKTITEHGLKNSPARLVPRGTTIISARGTVGKLAMTSRQMTFNQSCYGLRSRRNRGDAFCYFATERAVGDLQSRSHGSVFSTITRQTFESVDVVDCSSAVLEAFADRVDGYLARICTLVEENRTLSALRDTLLPKLMSGELRVGEARYQVEEVA